MKRAHDKPVRRDAGRPRGEAVLSSIFACTLAELAEHGPENLSVERIAKAAELNKTSIYRRWPTREALIAATLERVAQQLSVSVAETGSLRGDLLAMADAVAAFVQQPAGVGLARAAMQDSAASEVGAMARRQLQQGASHAAMKLVERAIARGEWRPDVSPEPVLSMLVGAIVHQVMLARQPTTSDWLATVVDVICHGVTGARRDAPATRA